MNIIGAAFISMYIIIFLNQRLHAEDYRHKKKNGYKPFAYYECILPNALYKICLSSLALPASEVRSDNGTSEAS